MKIKENISITLSKKDIEEIVIEHLKKKGYTTKNLYFNIDAEYDPADWQDRYGPTYVLGGAKADVEKIK
jgi:hypothetical protein